MDNENLICVWLSWLLNVAVIAGYLQLVAEVWVNINMLKAKYYGAKTIGICFSTDNSNNGIMEIWFVSDLAWS